MGRTVNGWWLVDQNCGTMLPSSWFALQGFKTNSRFIQWMRGPLPTVQNVTTTSPVAPFIG